jgi:hypothetical protein
MQLIRYFLIVGIAAVLLTAFVTRFTNKGLRQSRVDFYGKINAVFDSAQQTDLLMVGSSRVLVHLDPRIMDSVTGLNSYNAGFNSATIKTCFNIISAAVKYQTHIKAVILNIDYGIFSIEQDPYKDAYYYPFENNGLDIKMTDSGSVGLVHKVRIFDVSLYDDYVKYAAIDGLLRPNRILPGYKGYQPHLAVNDFKNIFDSSMSSKEIFYSADAFNLLKQCIAICRQHHVQLIMVMAPYYKRQSPEKYYSNAAQVVNTIEQTAKQNNVPFFNYCNLSFANEEQYFYNMNHLNSKGAALYTQAVADSIKRYLAGN